MHGISKRPFYEAVRKYPRNMKSLEDVYKVLRRGDFYTPEQMRCIFPSLDNFKYKDKWWVLDVAGNHLRAIAYIQFSQNRMYVKHILTHANYEKLSRRYMRGEYK